jgi:hypothetical protein
MPIEITKKNNVGLRSIIGVVGLFIQLYINFYKFSNSRLASATIFYWIYVPYIGDNEARCIQSLATNSGCPLVRIKFRHP